MSERCFRCWPMLAAAILCVSPAVFGGAEKTVRIDARWLAARQAPYLLDAAGTTYVLDSDVKTEGTGFVIAAANVTLDLNGHTLTYGDREPPVVRNGGFEEGKERDVPGWDVTEAKEAALADNTSLLHGKRVLRLSNFRTPQRIISEPINVTWPGRTHVATLTPANPKTKSGLTLSVVDAVTGTVLAKEDSPNTARGDSAVVRFVPKGKNAIRLQIDVTPPKDTVTSLDLDAATVAVEGDHGVLAAHLWATQLPGADALPQTVRAAYDARRVARFTLRNGKIVQGRGRGHASPPLFFRSVPGVTVERIETLAQGMDTETLDATNARGAVTIRDCVFREEIDNISQRMRNFATVKLAGIRGPIVVEGNKLLGSPQIGMVLASNDAAHTVRIRRNEIRQKGIVSNGYGILCSALAGFEISDNIIKPESGKGLCFDSYGNGLLGPGEICGNTVEVREKPNREYPHSLEAVALRLRNSVDRKGPQKGLRIHDNRFSARCGPGYVQQAYGARISYVNRDGIMKDARIVINDNTFEAVADSAEAGYHARALVFDRLEAGVDLSLRNNVLASNDISLALGDTGGGVEGALLISNTFRRVDVEPSRRYHGVLAGYYTRDVRDVCLIDLRLEGGATASVAWGGSGRKEVAFGRLLDVKVEGSDGSPLAGATVQLLDADGKEVQSGRTSEDGMVRGLTLVTSVRRQAGAGGRGESEEARSRYRVRVEHEGKTTEAAVDLKSNSSLTLPLR